MDKLDKVKKQITRKRQAEIQEKRIRTLKANKAIKKEAEAELKADLEAKQALRDEVLNVDLFDKQVETLRLYQDTFDICREIVDDAKKNPLEISASKLQVILRMMNTAQEALKTLEKLQQQQQELDAKGGDPDGMTQEEQELVDQFESLQKGYE